MPDKLHGTLKARAAREGMSLSDFIKRELEHVAERPTMQEWLERTRQVKRIPLPNSAAQIIRGLRGKGSGKNVRRAHMKDDRNTVRLAHETKSDLFRKAVEKQPTAEESSLTAYYHAKKAGLVGMVKGAGRDLSTNPKNFEGFGRSAAR